MYTQEFFITKLNKRQNNTHNTTSHNLTHYNQKGKTWNRIDHLYQFNAADFIRNMITAQLEIELAMYPTYKEYIEDHYKDNIWDKWNGFHALVIKNQNEDVNIESQFDCKGRLTKCSY